MPAERRARSRLGLAVLSLVVLAGQTGCSRPEPTPSITVLAAASLRPSFTRIAERFEADNPGITVHFDFASSPDLATQLLHGAAGDVFASADTLQMDKLTQAGLTTGQPVNFASNTVVAVTAPGNPKGIASFADLTKPGLAVVISPPPMPCGVAVQHIEESTGLRLDPVSAEPDVEDVLNKVVTGEADAGLVTRSDAVVAGEKVTTVTFPEAAGPVITYPITVLDTASQPGPAHRFVDVVTGEQGQQILRQAGFGDGA